MANQRQWDYEGEDFDHVDKLHSDVDMSTDSPISIVEQIVTPAVLVDVDDMMADILPPMSALMSPLSAMSSQSSHRALEAIMSDPDDDEEEAGFHSTLRGKGGWGHAEMPTQDPSKIMQSGASSWGDISPKLMNLAKYNNVLRSQEMYGEGSGGATAMDTLHKLVVDDLTMAGRSDNFDPNDSAADSGQDSAMRVQRLYNKMMGEVIAKPVLDQMAMLMYPSVPSNKVETSSVQKLLLEIAKGIVAINDRGALGMTEQHSAEYWTHKDPLAEFKGGKIAFNVEMQPPDIKRMLNIDIKGRMMGAETHERVERASREIGYDPYAEYYLEILKSQDDTDTEQHPDNRVKRAQRVGELGTTELVTKWVPKNCTILFINYFDGKEYPVTMNSRTKAGKLYDVAKSILLNSSSPHAPKRMELYRHNDYDEALDKNDRDELDKDGTQDAQRRREKQIEDALEKAEKAVKLTKDVVVNKLKQKNLNKEADDIEKMNWDNISDTLGTPSKPGTSSSKFEEELSAKLETDEAKELIVPLVAAVRQLVSIHTAQNNSTRSTGLMAKRLGLGFNQMSNKELEDESTALLLHGLIPEDSEDAPCAGYRKSKIYMVCQREDGKCTPHYVFGNDPPTLDNIVIGDNKLVMRTTKNQTVYKKAIKVATAKGYLSGDAKPEQIHIFASDRKVPKEGENGAHLRFCKYFGDALIRVVSDVSPPTSKVVFKTADGRTRSVLLRLDASVRELYQAAVKLLGVHYLPKDMRDRYIGSGEVPSLVEMEDVLNVQLFVGTGEQKKKINAKTLVDNVRDNVSGISGDQPQQIDIDVAFYTRDGGDWNSCVIQLYMSFSGSSKLYSNRYIPNMTLVMDSSDNNTILYDRVRQHVSQYIGSNTNLSKIEIKTHDGTKVDKNKDLVCEYGSQHFMVYLEQQAD